MEEVLNLLGNYGFPMAMCLLLYFQSVKQTDAHKEETKLFTESLNKNTIAIEKLQTTIEGKVINNE